VTGSIRIATYNIHKCRGLDRRVRPERIAHVIAELNADVVALQEVLHAPDDGDPFHDQAQFIAHLLGYSLHFGENRRLRGAAYGNATLTRLPVRFARNYDLTWKHRERRGCFRTDLECAGVVLHLFNVHLGTSFLERRRQGRKLVSDEVLGGGELHGRVVVVGDFNEWTRGLASRLMGERYCSVDLRKHTRRRRSYPGVAPLLHLDHFYFDQGLRLERFALHRSRTALLASDHLPMVGEFRLAESPALAHI